MPKEPSKRTRFETGLRLLNRPIRHLRFKSVASWRNGTTKHYRASAAIDGHLLRLAVKVGRTTRFSMAHLRLRAGSRRPLRESSPREERGESPQTGAKPGATLRGCSARAAERFLRRVDQGAQRGIDALLFGKIPTTAAS